MKYVLVGLILVSCANFALPRQDEPLEFRRVVAKSILETFNASEGSVATGFTIMIGETKYLVTNAHVCGSPPFNLMAKSDQTGEIYPMVPVVESITRDLCIAELIGAEAIPPLLLARKDPEEGSSVVTLGYPLGRYLRMMGGQIEHYYTKGMPRAATNLFILPGQSGSPVFNSDKEVVGVVFATDVGPTHTGWIIPLSSLKALIRELYEHLNKSNQSPQNRYKL